MLNKMKSLIAQLLAANKAYYGEDDPIMTDLEYDQQYHELEQLEQETGIVLASSPTQRVSGEVLDSLTAVTHTKPMLSADKTKSTAEIFKFISGRKVVVSWKLDGLTLVLRYEGGKLAQAITRGDGLKGEDVTHTVRVMGNVPLTIPCTDPLEVRGEGVISWQNFNELNETLAEPYSHPRNLAAGSIRKLDAEESKKRRLEFLAFDLISENLGGTTKWENLRFLAQMGFTTVGHSVLAANASQEAVEQAIALYRPEEYAFPVDGLIFEYDDLAYGRSLGATGHHENRLMALKWADTLYDTVFRCLEVATIDLQQVNWIGALFKESADFIATVTGDAVLADMCRHNVPICHDDPKKYVRYWEQNKRLFTRVAQMFPAQTTVNGKYQNCIPVIFWIETHYGTNEAMYFAEQLVRSGVRNMRFNSSYQYHAEYEIEGFTKIMESEHNINLRRFIDYICFDLYRQGYGEVNGTFFREYLDYLSMQKNFYGKVKEKYPEHFKTAHDVIALKVNLARLAEQCQNFTEQAAQVKDLEFIAQGYCITVPTEPRELADEGINLSHCVGDYIDLVASGACHILFLRRRNAPDQSLVTLQLSGRKICQAQGANRRAITQSERKFLSHWGREKNIEIAV